ncbi:dephospho-CoA kinase [Mycolicibacterium brumae]|uniref:Dephospho-CoA kinase n=1 Tax=Mycolicibacterium brumae TaxID=85968 RepID=A0A2G5P746_9MYCO|nr:dephospho-CoA kinase [Mycolicibacterium brumae]PIB74189.1 dephospho-CoA kinase [Mycolicibacterium brumae]RWA22976.1 hypothetical protein MBRU_11595 [Mycolicibacterium brumae DSM 44177]
MLRIGLTGGIGAGKSTVSSMFASYGALVIDSDLLAREVVEPGTPGLLALVEAFGDGILAADGSLNRPALAAVAFADETKRRTLNGIVHPLIAQRRAELIATANPAGVVVEDIPLLVENGLAPLFPMVVVVHADVEDRVARLMTHRGFTEQDARARIAAQATDEQRRAVADVWLDNSSSPDELTEKASLLWFDRVAPFAVNLAERRAATVDPVVVPPNPEWPAQADRIIARLRAACGQHARKVEHVGPTTIPGRAAEDLIHIDLHVGSPAAIDTVAEPLLAVGYPRVVPGLHASADPGRPTHVRLLAS